VDDTDADRQQHPDPDIATEERRTLARRHRLAARLGIDSRLAEYLLELQERIERLEDRQDSILRSRAPVRYQRSSGGRTEVLVEKRAWEVEEWDRRIRRT
jgi:hypothetical protein